MPSCLNEYHRQFLSLLVRHGTRFLIIGGQARALHHGADTRDLDVWVDISAEHRSTTEQAVSAWSREHRAHSMLQLPVSLAPGIQIRFPAEDAWFIAVGALQPIASADGIDVLTSIGSADFAEFYDRADWRDVAGLRLPFLSAGDLDLISPAKG